MAKLGAILLLFYLLFGTVAGDRIIGGPDTSGYLLWIVGGAVVLAGLYSLGIVVAKANASFLGFKLWQWVTLPSASLIAGIIIRMYVMR